MMCLDQGWANLLTHLRARMFCLQVKGEKAYHGICVKHVLDVMLTENEKKHYSRISVSENTQHLGVY